MTNLPDTTFDNNSRSIPIICSGVYLLRAIYLSFLKINSRISNSQAGPLLWGKVTTQWHVLHNSQTVAVVELVHAKHPCMNEPNALSDLRWLYFQQASAT